MDHLEEAKAAMDSIHANKRLWNATSEIELAKAHALIALVERLDKVIATDCEGKTGSISVDTG